MKELKQQFNPAELYLVVFSKEDVITTSSEFEGIEDDLTNNYSDWATGGLS